MTSLKTKNSTHNKPQRSCAACRVRGDKDSFIRIVRDSSSGEAVIDSAMKLPGRGAYICPDLACVTKARKGKLAGALRVNIQQEFWGKLEAFIKNNERSNAVER